MCFRGSNRDTSKSIFIMSFPADGLRLIRQTDLGSRGHLMAREAVGQLSMFAPEVTLDPLVSAILQIDALRRPPALTDHFRKPQIDKEWSCDVRIVLVHPSFLTYVALLRAKLMIRFSLWFRTFRKNQPPSEPLKMTQTLTSVVSLLLFCLLLVLSDISKSLPATDLSVLALWLWTRPVFFCSKYHF